MPLHELFYRLIKIASIIYKKDMVQLLLAEVLKKKEMSKRQFAKRLDIDYSSVFRFFRPKYDPKLSSLQKWAKVLDVKIKDLYKE